ncbi:hypothetical protein ACQKH5_13240 [Hyphomonas sp. NPDC076900]|uniref:hypothetical protein n=1 Tax=unclassified Hyphomonas TaxID=2630699 RepID=UPI003D012433
MSIIRLDLSALQATAQITPEEAARLTALALPDRRGSLAVNLLLIFGAIAVSVAAIALVPNAATGLLLALGALAGAEGLRRLMTGESFTLLGTALALMGTLGLAGWVGWEFRETHPTQPALLITFLLTAGAIWYRSAFLAALAVVALGAVFGSGTGYWHASYALFVEEPTLTIAVFGLLTAGLYRLRGHVPESWSNLITVAARTSLILVHFAFWVGSLWGDVLGGARWAYEDTAQPVFGLAPWIFAIGWAALSLTLAFMARRGGFLSVSAVVFLAIHGYTQYFETFGAEPLSLLIAGLVLVGLAIAAARFVRARPGA